MFQSTVLFLGCLLIILLRLSYHVALSRLLLKVSSFIILLLCVCKPSVRPGNCEVKLTLSELNCGAAYSLLSLNSAAFCYSGMFNITCKARKHHIVSVASFSFVSVKRSCATGKSDGSDTGISSIWLPLGFQGILMRQGV